MFTPRFAQALARPPISKRALAEICGFNEFDLSRFSRFLLAAQQGDPRVLRLVRALGLTPDEAFTNQAGERSIAATVRTALQGRP